VWCDRSDKNLPEPRAYGNQGRGRCGREERRSGDTLDSSVAPIADQPTPPDRQHDDWNSEDEQVYCNYEDGDRHASLANNNTTPGILSVIEIYRQLRKVSFGEGVGARHGRVESAP
jgi:hypothetical protein